MNNNNMSQAMRTMTSQTTQEWYTPTWILDTVRAFLGGIGLDPASSPTANRLVRAGTYRYLNIPERYLTGHESPRERELKLKQLSAQQLHNSPPWKAQTVFLNPPFNNTPMWVDRMLGEYGELNFEEGILLVNSACGYKWWESLHRQVTVCLLEERQEFLQYDPVHDEFYTKGPAKKGQTLAYFGEYNYSFEDTFKDYGRVLL